ncbi:asparagine synthetase B family protein [Marinobacter fonticola]|uniref:hypothetical protein n=1 Tax=Marinobacter fonticola TaxID=2603215 RepID=UPI0011E65D51|nr:hypothetical protein [Marinobacter fonticola]
MENLFTADIGGKDAELLFQRLGDESTYTLDGPYASIATNGRVVEESDNVLVIVGTPLPSVSQVPKNWREAKEQLPAHDGVFSMLYWDREANKLVIISDFMGFYPLYVKRDQGRIYFSTATRAFEGDFDAAGWGTFITLGQTLGNATLTAGVERVAPASLMVIDLATREMEVTQYWRPEPHSTVPTVDQVHESLRSSTDQIIAAHKDDDHFVLMSGGFDSRLIACMLTRQNLSFRGVLVSHYDENLDAETRFGRAMAKKLGFSCEYRTADRDFFSSEEFLHYLFASDAETPSLYLFISQVLQFVPRGGVVWDGFIPGTLLKNAITDASPADRIELAFQDYLKRLGTPFDGKTWKAARQLFKPEIARQFEDAFQAQWESVTSEYANDEDGISDFHFDHRNRTRTLINPFKAFRTRAKTVTPGTTRDFVNLARSVPEQAKRDNDFYRKLYEHYYPEAYTVPLVKQNKLVPPKHFSPSFEAFRLLNKLHGRLSERPRLMRYLGIDPHKYRFRNSSFLDVPQLYDTPDPALNQDFLKKLQTGDVVSPAAVRLLFHWRAWRWLHEQRLYQNFKG